MVCTGTRGSPVEYVIIYEYVRTLSDVRIAYLREYMHISAAAFCLLACRQMVAAGGGRVQIVECEWRSSEFCAQYIDRNYKKAKQSTRQSQRRTKNHGSTRRVVCVWFVHARATTSFSFIKE